VKLRQKKQEATKLRKRAENQLKEVHSTERRSTSGLHSIDKKIESEREDVSDVSGVLTQKNAQLESIERLVNSAEERLSREKEEIERVQQEIDFSESPEEKQNAEFRLRSLNERVSELVAEIKSRQKTAKKITLDVSQFSDIKSKITTKIQKQSKSKPTLRDAASTSHKAAAKFVKELERRTKSEESAKKVLDNASAKLQELLKKRKSAKKKVAKRRPAKKTASKKKVAKRRPAKKTASKKKVAKRRPAKKTASKKKVAKRRPAKKSRR
jgi:chromosome segregation ATPase